MAALIVMAVGALLIVGGVALLSVPAAIIIAGLLCVAAGVDLTRSAR